MDDQPDETALECENSYRGVVEVSFKRDDMQPRLNSTVSEHLSAHCSITIAYEQLKTHHARSTACHLRGGLSALSSNLKVLCGVARFENPEGSAQ